MSHVAHINEPCRAHEGVESCAILTRTLSHTYIYIYTCTHTHTHTQTGQTALANATAAVLNTSGTSMTSRKSFYASALGGSHVTWMSHVTRMNETCGSCEWVMTHKWVSRVLHMDEAQMSNVAHANAPEHVTWMSHVMLHHCMPQKSHIISYHCMPQKSHVIACVTNESCHRTPQVMLHHYMHQTSQVSHVMSSRISLIRDSYWMSRVARHLMLQWVIHVTWLMLSRTSLIRDSYWMSRVARRLMLHRYMQQVSHVAPLYARIFFMLCRQWVMSCCINAYHEWVMACHHTWVVACRYKRVTSSEAPCHVARHLMLQWVIHVTWIISSRMSLIHDSYWMSRIARHLMLHRYMQQVSHVAPLRATNESSYVVNRPCHVASLHATNESCHIVDESNHVTSHMNESYVTLGVWMSLIRDSYWKSRVSQESRARCRVFENPVRSRQPRRITHRVKILESQLAI